MSLRGILIDRSNCRAAWIVAGLLVLAAQTVSVVHELDPQNQAPDHVCEVCVATAGVDFVDVGKIDIVVPTLPAIERSAHADSGSAVRSFLLPPSRGPPAVS